MLAVYPGSFDPITYGHLDIIERVAKKVDKLTVAVLNNKNKNSIFSVEERMRLIKGVTKHIPNVSVDRFDGLLIDYAIEIGADVLIRGLRAVSDYEYEMQMSLCNKALYPEIETFFLVAKSNYSFLSSSIVREIASFGGDISKFVPRIVEEEMIKKYNNK